MSENRASQMGAVDQGFAWSAARPGAAPAAGLCKHALLATRERARHSRHVRLSESARLCHRAASCASAARRLRVHRRGPGRRGARGRGGGREGGRERADCRRGTITLRYRRLQETGLGPRQSGRWPRTSPRADSDATCKRPMPLRRSSAEPIPVSACLPDRAGAPSGSGGA